MKTSEKTGGLTPKLSNFSSSRRKVSRAVKHIEELERSIKSYFSRRWYTSSTRRVVDGNLDMQVRVLGTPRDADLAVGDAIHNLRAALDLAAVEAVRCGGGSGNGASFPFSESAQNIEETMHARKIHRAPTAVQNLIRKLRPYHGGNAALRALHDLDIADKHHSLIEIATTITTPRVRVLCDERGTPIAGVDGKARLEVESASEPVAVFTFAKDSPLAGKSLVETLRFLRQMVSDIIDSFDEACQKLLRR